MTEREALNLALDALKTLMIERGSIYDKAITAIREALAQPEPVAWEQFYPDIGKPKLAYLSPTESPDNACYIPPQRTWVGLTLDERIELAEDVDWAAGAYCEYAEKIEAKLKELNT